MGKHVVVAVAPGGAEPPVYLLGFCDVGEAWECRWTASRAHARWFDADEAEVEARLLAHAHAGRLVLSHEPVSA